jgi:hypothetical protein
VYFREYPNDQAAGDLVSKWQMEKAPRNSRAQQAYDDFLRGLEVAGMQEHVPGDGSHTGKDIPDPERKALLQKLLGVKYRNSYEPDGGDHRKDMHHAAEWERFVQLRKDAPIRRRWMCQLQRRAQSDLADPPEPGLYPPIRNNTFKMLVRPTERDFDMAKFVLMIVTVVTMFLSFFSQIDQIQKLCGSAFLCPAGGEHASTPSVSPLCLSI